MRTRLFIATAATFAFSLTAWIVMTAEGSTEPFGPEKGWLILAGGKEPPPAAIVQRFLSLAGGPEANVVVFTTAATPTPVGDRPITKELIEAAFMGDRNITILDTHDRAVADSESFVAPLRTTGGVWFTGGNPDVVVNTYVGTRTQKELQALLARGSVIGGTSAGALVQGEKNLHPGLHDDIAACRTPSCSERQAFGFVRNVFIIAHVVEAHWENLLAQGMAMYPGLLGIGVDEGAAVVVHGNQCEVIGDGKILLPNGSGPDGNGYEALTSGARFDLARAIKRMNLREGQSRK